MRIPKDYYSTNESVMTNFDHSIDREVEKELKENNCHAHYAGWNFSGEVWYQNDKFYCEVWTYNSYNETIQGNTLEEIMEKVCEEYGSD